jgi:hypothetical protein
VFTLYRNKTKDYKEFTFQGISIYGALVTPAYGSCKIKVSVEQHYFARHKITLRYPQLQCAIDKCNGNSYFYPLELIQLVPHPPPYRAKKTVAFKELSSRHFNKRGQYNDYKRKVSNGTQIYPKILQGPALKRLVNKSPTFHCRTCSPGATSCGGASPRLRCTRCRAFPSVRRALTPPPPGMIRATNFLNYFERKNEHEFIARRPSTPTLPAKPLSPPRTPVKLSPVPIARSTPEPEFFEPGLDFGRLQLEDSASICATGGSSPGYQQDIEEDYQLELIKGDNSQSSSLQNRSTLDYLKDENQLIGWLDEDPEAARHAEELSSEGPSYSPQSPDFLGDDEEEMEFTEQELKEVEMNLDVPL